jgi:hypothetical protein
VRVPLLTFIVYQWIFISYSSCSKAIPGSDLNSLSFAVGAKHSERLQISVPSVECFALPAKQDFPLSCENSIRARAKHFKNAVIFQPLFEMLGPYR